MLVSCKLDVYWEGFNGQRVPGKFSWKMSVYEFAAESFSELDTLVVYIKDTLVARIPYKHNPKYKQKALLLQTLGQLFCLGIPQATDISIEITSAASTA